MRVWDFYDLFVIGFTVYIIAYVYDCTIYYAYSSITFNIFIYLMEAKLKIMLFAIGVSFFGRDLKLLGLKALEYMGCYDFFSRIHVK